MTLKINPKESSNNPSPQELNEQSRRHGDLCPELGIDIEHFLDDTAYRCKFRVRNSNYDKLFDRIIDKDKIKEEIYELFGDA